VATAEAAERAAELAEEVMHDFVNGDPGLNQVLNATYPLTMFATIPRLADCLARYALRNQDYGPKVNKEHPGPAFQMVNTIDMISQLCVTRLASDEIHDALKGEPELRDATEYDVMLSTLDKPEDVGDTGSTEEERADLDTRFHYGLYRYHDQIAQNRERCNRIRDEMKNVRRNQYYIQDQDAHSMQVRYRQNMALAINALQETQPSEDVSNPDERMLLSIALGNSKYTGKQALNVNDAKEMAQWRRAVKSVAALTIWARARLKGGEPKRIVAEEIQSRQNVSEDLAIQIVVDAQEECATSTATFEPSKQARMLHLSLTTDTTWLDRMRSSVSFQTLHPRMRTDARNQTASPYRRNGSASKPVLAAYRVVAAYTVGLQSDHESTAQVYAMNRFGELRDANCRNEVIATDDKMEDQQVRELTSALGRVMVDDENVAPAVKVAKGYGISVEGGRSVNELIIDTFNAIGGNSSEILYKHEQYSDGLSIVAAALDLQMAYNEIKMLVKETVDADREAAAAALKSAAEQGPDANRGGGDDPALDEMLNLNKGEVQEAKKILLEIAQPKAKAPATN
jgi:hypothetical protein